MHTAIKSLFVDFFGPFFFFALCFYFVMRQITDRLIMSAMMRSVLMFNGNLGNSLWLMALGGPVGRCVSVMLNKNIYTEVSIRR